MLYYMVTEPGDGLSKTAEIILSRSKVKEVLGEFHGVSLGGLVGINKTLDNVMHRYYWLHARSDVEWWCLQCDIYAEVQGPRTLGRA